MLIVLCSRMRALFVYLANDDGDGDVTVVVVVEVPTMLAMSGRFSRNV